MNKYKHIINLVMLVGGLGVMLFILWLITFGPLKECPFHAKDPNGICIVTPPKPQESK